MGKRWTRECIIRQLLERQAQGLLPTTGWRGGDHAIRSAAQRIFGSWRNALLAAGIAPRETASSERWSPTKILVVIRQLARRKRPLTCKQMERRYRNIVTAARRHFGSWNKAVLSAGVDPSKLQRVPPWKPERILEAILTRALRNESLAAQQVEPRSLIAAGKRFFGNWPAAVAAAGLDPALTARKPILHAHLKTGEVHARRRPTSGTGSRQRRWNKDCIIAELHQRLRDHKPVNSTALAREYPRLYDAMRRHCGSWLEAMHAAGLDPDSYIVTPAARGAARAAARSHQQVAVMSRAQASLRPETPH